MTEIASSPALIESLPGANFVLQLAGLGALVGTAVAYVLTTRDPGRDPWRPVALVTLAGTALALLVQLIAEVSS